MTATDVLREYAKAIRRNWGCIDGRGVKNELEMIADAIDDGNDTDMRSLRLSVDICPKGGGFWIDDCCERAGCNDADCYQAGDAE